MIAASIQILVPAFNWIVGKLSRYRQSVKSWSVAISRKMETTPQGRSSQSGRQSSKRKADSQSEEYILPTYPTRGAKNSGITISHEVTISHNNQP